MSAVTKQEVQEWRDRARVCFAGFADTGSGPLREHEKLVGHLNRLASSWLSLRQELENSIHGGGLESMRCEQAEGRVEDLTDLLHRFKALADQAAAGADDTGPSVVVAKDGWYALLEAIYDADGKPRAE